MNTYNKIVTVANTILAAVCTILVVAGESWLILGNIFCILVATYLLSERTTRVPDTLGGSSPPQSPAMCDCGHTKRLHLYLIDTWGACSILGCTCPRFKLVRP